MKSWVITLAVVLASVGLMLVKSRSGKAEYREGFDLAAFGELPVQEGGRVKPLDSLARDRMMLIRAKQAYYELDGQEEKTRRAAVQWLLDANLRPQLAAEYRVMRIDHEQVLGLIGRSHEDKRKEFSVEELRPHLDKVIASAQRLEMDGKQPSEMDEYEKALIRLKNGLLAYSATAMGLPQSLMPGSVSLVKELHGFEATLGPGLEAEAKREAGEPYDEEVLHRLQLFRRLYGEERPHGNLGLIPPVLSPQRADAYLGERPIADEAEAEAVARRLHDDEGAYREKVQMAMWLAEKTSDRKEVSQVFRDYVDKWKKVVVWQTPRDSLLDSASTGRIDPLLMHYATMFDAYAEGRPEAFNQAVEEARAELAARAPQSVQLAAYEERLNQFAPFIASSTLYVCVFLATVFSWLVASRSLNRAALILMALGAGIHLYGLIGRMIIMDRPLVWVTNLYSSAVFIGFATVVVCLILEFFSRLGLAAACGSVVGVLTQIVAHHLSRENPDTLRPLQAVLDTNYWLSTHVTAVTMGYSATFLAGALAIGYILAGIFRPSIPQVRMQSMSRMVYGIVCFALLLSTVGTLAGGIWADESWGRFWGWDPKENGALMIVLWNALVLHARWGRVCGDWGIMCLVVFGNVITSWSWFGTNLLGIGLHAYGFNSTTATYLGIFLVFNLAIITAGLTKLILMKVRAAGPVEERSVAKARPVTARAIEMQK